MNDLIKLMRPHQYVKNLFVLAPIFFAGAIMQEDALFKGVLAFVAVAFVLGSFFRPEKGTNQTFLMSNESKCSMNNLQKATKIILPNHINSVDVLNPQISYFMKGMNYRLDTLTTEESIKSFFNERKNYSVVSCGYYAKLIKSNLPLTGWIEDHFTSYYFDDVWVMVPKN